MSIEQQSIHFQKNTETLTLISCKFEVNRGKWVGVGGEGGCKKTVNLPLSFLFQKHTALDYLTQLYRIYSI